MYICVRVFECVRDRERERASTGQKWKEESAATERRERGERSGLNQESSREKRGKTGFDGCSI